MESNYSIEKLLGTKFVSAVGQYSTIESERKKISQILCNIHTNISNMQEMYRAWQKNEIFTMEDLASLNEVITMHYLMMGKFQVIFTRLSCDHELQTQRILEQKPRTPKRSRSKDREDSHKRNRFSQPTTPYYDRSGEDKTPKFSNYDIFLVPQKFGDPCIIVGGKTQDHKFPYHIPGHISCSRLYIELNHIGPLRRLPKCVIPGNVNVNITIWETVQMDTLPMELQSTHEISPIFEWHHNYIIRGIIAFLSKMDPPRISSYLTNRSKIN